MTCRACGAGLEPYCDLGWQPLANAFLDTPDQPEERYPLVLAHCNQCWLSQLTVTVERDTLYRNYHYVSGVSPAWLLHLDSLVEELPCRKRFVVEIASNDGALLRKLKDAGASVLGVEPATNLTAHYEPGLPFLPDYFTDKTARWITTRYGHADIVIAQNVIGHVDDIKGFLWALQHTLNKRRGVAILEMPYLYRMLATQEFPQVYHEHLSYWSLWPLRRICQEVGLSIVAVKPINVHGGSMRYYLKHADAKVDPSIHELATREAQLQSDPYTLGIFDPKPQIAAIERDLEQYRGKKVWGYGASAKATVLLNAISNAGIIAQIMDDHTGKQGRFMPGVHTPIVAPQDLSGVDALVVLAWNWGPGIEVRAKNLGFKGEYIYPFQKPRKGTLARIA